MSEFKKMQALAKNLLRGAKEKKQHLFDNLHDDGPSSSSSSSSQDRKVFAHYMLGLTHGQTLDEWRDEIARAHACGIDGFALNFAPLAWAGEQLRNAYAAAAAADADFVLFLSFDMAQDAAGEEEWDVAAVAALVREFRDAPAQFCVRGRPFVSTFEGPRWAERWAAVARLVGGGIYLVPDWSSLGPGGIRQRLDLIDGAFSWCAWPRANETQMTADEDVLYRRSLGGKSYMMGVSPWFYTRLPQWHKNWHSSSERLWYDRWMHVLDEKPDFVQIITWNDYGESSYISDPLRPGQLVPGAAAYVDGHSHAALCAVLPHLIAAYKAGSARVRPPPPGHDVAVAWYRTTPAGCAPHGDTVWGQGGDQPASRGARDVVCVLAITREPRAAVTVGIGASSEVLEVRHGRKHGHVSYLEVPFGGRTGPVVLSLDGGRAATGPAITDACPAQGHLTFNCVAIQVRS